MHMYNEIIYGVCAVLCAALLAFAMTPIVRVFAVKIKAIDVPRDGRRMHQKPIPRTGGLAIFLSFLISAVGFCSMDRELVTILIGGGTLVLLGVLDDVYRLNAFVKLAVQIVVALFAVSQGVTIDFIGHADDLQRARARHAARCAQRKQRRRGERAHPMALQGQIRDPR